MGYLRTLLHGISIFPRPPKRGEGHFIASVPGGAPRTLDTPVSVSVSLYLASVGSTIPQVDCCTQVTDVVGRQRLRSATQQLSTSAIHCWTPSIRCTQPRGLELLARRPPCTAGLRVLQTGSENLAFLQILAC